MRSSPRKGPKDNEEPSRNSFCVLFEQCHDSPIASSSPCINLSCFFSIVSSTALLLHSPKTKRICRSMKTLYMVGRRMRRLREEAVFWLLLVAAAGISKCTVTGERHVVGKSKGWAQNVNYTAWASQENFYVGDLLYFKFDKRYYNVLEVNKTNYEQCNDRDFLTNFTRGGRDFVELKEARNYYFISSGGYCYHGMKLAINVQIKPAPAPAPQKSDSSPGKGSALVVIVTLAIVSASMLLQYLLK